MTFTKEQLKTLSAWETNFRTAVFKQWASTPGSTALRVIYDIYTQMTGDRRRFSDNCSHCVLSLLQDCGKVYFKDKEEMIARENDAKAVELSQAAANPVKKARIKTKK
jgi:hypothetical protein